MGLLLCLETATTVCSVALAQDGHLLALRETHDSNAHSSRLTLLIEEVLQQSGKLLKDLDAVAVSKGPGSYTGLRIGVSTAKGLCYGLDKPLIAVSTLQAMAYGMSVQCDAPNDTLLCPMIDARRMEVYMALYDSSNKLFSPTVAEIIHADTFADVISNHTILCAGDGAEKCKAFFENQKNVLFPAVNIPSAQYIVPLAEQAFQQQQFEDVAYFEPYYLKDFVAGMPKVKGLE
jgi:tRNA threonylcarbamoyladenosine biosynthesis protein TsaB